MRTARPLTVVPICILGVGGGGWSLTLVGGGWPLTLGDWPPPQDQTTSSWPCDLSHDAFSVSLFQLLSELTTGGIICERFWEFFLIFGGHKSCLLIPLFLDWWHLLGFKERVGSPIYNDRCIHVTYSLRFTSGATPANWLPSQSLPHTCHQALVGLKDLGDLSLHKWMLYTDWAMPAYPKSFSFGGCSKLCTKFCHLWGAA